MPTSDRRSGSSDVRLIDVNGQTFRVAIRHGQEDRPPLLLLNGIGASLEVLQPFVDAVDGCVTIIRVDPPGIGGSPTPRRPYRFSTLCRQIALVLDEMGYTEVDVLGISWGGGLAQQFAITNKSRVRKLVLVATSTGSVMLPGRPQALLRMATPRRHRDAGYMLRIAGDIYGGSVRDRQEHLLELLTYFGRGGQRTGYALQLLAGAGWTSLPLLPLIRQPTLVLTGDDDPIIHKWNGRILAGLIPRSELHIYSGGHIELVADPGQLLPTIERFLDLVAPAAEMPA